MRTKNAKNIAILTILNKNSKQPFFFLPPTTPNIPFTIIQDEVIQNASKSPCPYENVYQDIYNIILDHRHLLVLNHGCTVLTTQ